MKRYISKFKEEEIPVYYKKKRITLSGKIKGKNYRIEIAPGRGGYDNMLITENHFVVYTDSNSKGGTVDQMLSRAFIEVFKIPIPINHDDIFGSGIDLNYMIYMLIENFNFKLV